MLRKILYFCKKRKNMAKKVNRKSEEGYEFRVLEDKVDFGFTSDRAPFRNPDAAMAARLKKRIEKLQARMKKSEDNKK